MIPTFQINFFCENTLSMQFIQHVIKPGNGMSILYRNVVDSPAINTHPPNSIFLRHKQHRHRAWTHALSHMSFGQQLLNLPLKFLCLLWITPIGWSVGIVALGTKSIWCFIPLIGGNPLGTSLGNTSSYSCNKETTTLGKDSSSSLVLKHISLYNSTNIGWFV